MLAGTPSGGGPLGQRVRVHSPRRDDVDDATAAPGAELHGCPATSANSVSSLATADAAAGVEVGAALADDDLAGVDELAAVALDAEALGVGVATVLGRRCALFVSHVLLSPTVVDGDAVILTWVYFWR